MKLSKALPICLLLLSPIVANAQNSSAVCRVSAYWWNRQTKIGSGLMLLGQFNPLVVEERTIKSFKSIDGDFMVTAGVEFPLDYSKSKPTPFEVRLAIIVSNDDEKVIFGALESSEASTHFKKRWNLSVSKNVDFEGKVYTFGLSCSDSIKSAR